MKLCYSPKTLTQNVIYYSLCLLLASLFFFRSGPWVHALTAVAAIMLAVVVVMMLTRRGTCWS